MTKRYDAGKPYRIGLDDDGGFDELVIGAVGACWFHIERMSRTGWWLRVGDQVLDIEVRRGKAVVRHRNSGRLLDEPER